MTLGLRVRDPVTGAVLITYDTHLTKVLGTFNTGTADGSFTDANLASGTGWAALLPPAGLAGKQLPTVTVSGTTVSWSWAGNPAAASRAAVDATYGFWT